MHLAQESHKNRSFSRASRADNEVEHALLEGELVVDAQTECLSRRGTGALAGLVAPREVGPGDADIVFVVGRAVNRGCQGRLLCEEV